MKRQILISSLILLSIHTVKAATIRLVPQQYPNIQSAINASVSGDTIVVDQGTYTGADNTDLDFGEAITGTRAITIRSTTNPDNPNYSVIANTIIDCQGSKTNKVRAFWFHEGETNNSKVIGFTIKNGYQRGNIGVNGPSGNWLYNNSGNPQFNPIPIDDPNDAAPYARNGTSPTKSDGYGGAILCENGSSPTIKHCVITNCTVTGAQGGDGAAGMDGPWYHYVLSNYSGTGGTVDPNATPREDADGQWGGDGGTGSGNGYGGAIACKGNSNPIISDCNISNNTARGGCGGAGGAGGNAAFTGTPPDITYNGRASSGGNAGTSAGDGIGGAIYAEGGSSPVITNCIFKNNTATVGIRGQGGQRGQGNPISVADGGPATNGDDSHVDSDGRIAGGAAYYKGVTSKVYFTNCTFTGNKACDAYDEYPGFGEDISAYTVGGAIDSNDSSTVRLNDSTFTNNLGGAVYCGESTGRTIDINNCTFTGNSDPHDYSELQPPNRNIDAGSGGAVFIGRTGTTTIRECTFGGNSAKNDGGAVNCRSRTTLTNCSFGGNEAFNGYGGGINAYSVTSSLVIDLNSCTFAENQAIYGGGISVKNSDVNIIDCYLVGNTADSGGGLDATNGDILILGGTIIANSATSGRGGAILGNSAKAEIRNSVISNNSATSSGGAIGFYGGDGGELIDHVVKNCLLISNTTPAGGGAIACENLTKPDINNCTFISNSAGYGGAIFTDWSSEPNITNSIFTGCNNHAIHEEDYGGNAIPKYNLFFNNPNGDYYDSNPPGVGTIYTGPTGTTRVGNIPGGSNNLYGDPLFVSNNFGNYYLSHTLTGQASNSPAVDSGSNTAALLGLDMLTTRTDSVPDDLQVDRGYHYPDAAGILTFQLTTFVAAGSGTISPPSGPYHAGSVVTLTATPNPGWRVKRWIGTYNDSSTSTTNTIVMNSDKTIGVEFEQPKTLTVSVGGGGGGYYSSIQDAVSAARDGDTIVVYPGTYYGGYGWFWDLTVYIDKHITVRSLNPDDPCCVAATIIDGYRQSPYMQGHTNDGVGFGPSTDANTVFNGFTIRNCGGKPFDGRNGDRDQVGPNGEDGGWVMGPGITIFFDGGPIIKNCVIRDNLIIGGDGGDGTGATGPPDSFNAGRGGWSGFAYGGGVYCGVNSSPAFINCRIIDNFAGGGTGGNGGNDVYPGGEENYGGNWSMRGSLQYPVYDFDPETSTITPIYDSNLWEVWQWDGALAYYYYLHGLFPPPSESYIGDYRWYSGLGGGVFIDEDSTVTFTDCQISGNVAKGGMSGQGGLDAQSQRPIEPLIPYEIPSFGGGVYCAAGSTVTFTGCTITDNLSSEPNVPPNHHIDPYLGHGGGVCAEDTATLTFTNCILSGNDADAGGGIHFSDANAVITDCNFIFNSSLHGGGLFMEHGLADILRCNFSYNIAATEPNDPNVVGTGGGLHLLATGANIIDCNISHNQAESSGGGLFFSGENDSVFKNCLLTNNSAGIDGGGISSSNFSSLSISNCTIADNIVSGTGSYGGGLYCAYNSYTNIIDSIFWGNGGQYGPQLAIRGLGGNPSVIDVSYSDIQGSQSNAYIGSGCSLNWGAGNIYNNPLFASGPLGDYYLSQLAGGQTSNSPCFNSGSSPAANLGMDKYTTRSDEQPDRSTVDMGYHYPFTPEAHPCRFCELSRDGIINFRDFAIFALRWLDEGCSQANQWCQHADVTLDTYVDLDDAFLFAECWLTQDTDAPTPNPSQWQQVPTPFWSASLQNSISMAAQTTTDAWDFWSGKVQYYFDCVSSGDCNDSGWQDGPNYVDSHLTIGIEYGYRVKARDASDPNNQTGWSSIRYAIAGEEPVIEDHTPPTPNPMTWAIVPNATSATSITMTATTATDSSGVAYYFEDFDEPIINSGWQNGTNWTDTGLEPLTTYRYRVKARDKSAWHNETGWSTVAEATTPEEGGEPNQPEEDIYPPTPVAWEVAPYETGSPQDAYANMTAAEATDENGPVEYYFECKDWPEINSGWTENRVWNDVYIGPGGFYYLFRFKVRDSLGNTSGWSTALPCY